MDRPSFSVQRDRLARRLGELARMIRSGEPRKIALAADELDRLARG